MGFLILVSTISLIISAAGDDKLCPVERRHANARKPHQACRMQRLHFVFFGDSLTERGFERGGWGAGMTDLYRRKVGIR